MLRIYVCRHGQDEDNAAHVLNGQRDTALTALGSAQAVTLAQRIAEAGIRFEECYASPLRRAYDTARIVTDSQGLRPPLRLPLLIERAFGEMTGRPIADIRRMCSPDIVQCDPILYFLKPKGGETYPQVLERAKQALEHVKRRHHAGSILLGTHGDMGKMLYAAYYGLDWLEVLRGFHLGNGDLLLLSKDSPPEDTHVFKFEQHNH